MATWIDFVKKAQVIAPPIYRPEVYREGAENIAKSTRKADDAILGAVDKYVSKPVGRALSGAAGALYGAGSEYLGSVGRGDLPPPGSTNWSPREGSDPEGASRRMAEAGKIGWNVGSDPVNSRYANDRLDLSVANVLHGAIPGALGMFGKGLGESASRLMDKTPLGSYKRTAERNVYGNGEDGRGGSLDAYLRKNYGDEETDKYYSKDGWKSPIVDDMIDSEKAIAYSEVPLHLYLGARMAGPVFGAAERLAQGAGKAISGAMSGAGASGVASGIASKVPAAGLTWLMFGQPYVEGKAESARMRKEIEDAKAQRDRRLVESKKEKDLSRAADLMQEIERPGPFGAPYKRRLVDELDELRARYPETIPSRPSMPQV